jgi:hypothetical protein
VLVAGRAAPGQQAQRVLALSSRERGLQTESVLSEVLPGHVLQKRFLARCPLQSVKGIINEFIKYCHDFTNLYQYFQFKITLSLVQKLD